MINILLIAAIFGFVLSTTFFLKESTNKVATYILGSFYFLLSVYALHAFIIDGGYLEHFTWFFLWPLLPYHLIFIPLYYYFKVILNDKLRFHGAELLLLIPFLLGVLDVVYVYLQPASFYDNLISTTIAAPDKRLRVDYWLLSLDQHLLVRHVWQLGVLVILLPRIRSFINKGENKSLKYILNKWLITFWSILLLMAFLAIVYSLEKMYQEKLFHSLIILGNNGGIITFFLYLAVFFIGIIPIYFPSILYGFPQDLSSNPNNSIKEQSEELKFGLDEQEVHLKLEALKKSKSYLKQNFNLTECAKELNMPSHHISYFLKSHYGMSFSVYKNTLRMDYAKKEIENGYLKNNTVEALALACGFSNRTSFSKAFKNATAVSPSHYSLNIR